MKMMSILLHYQILPDNEDRKLFGAMIVISANAGGAWTPIGTNAHEYICTYTQCVIFMCSCSDLHSYLYLSLCFCLNLLRRCDDDDALDQRSDLSSADYHRIVLALCRICPPLHRCVHSLIFMGILLIIHISPIPIPKDDTVCGSVLRVGGREGKRRVDMKMSCLSIGTRLVEDELITTYSPSLTPSSSHHPHSSLSSSYLQVFCSTKYPKMPSCHPN